jgi:threonine dehydrogenase-like Zn-dependent dehydrogenase
VEAVGNEVRGLRTGELIYTQSPHASTCLIDPARNIWARLPAGLDPQLAALTTILAIGLYGVRRGRIDDKLCEPVLIIGDGPIGLAAALFARLMGAWPVVVIGRHDFRLAVAQALGASATVNVSSRSLLELNDLAIEPPAVIILAAPCVNALREAFLLCAPRGRIVILCTFGHADHLLLHSWYDKIQSKDLSLHFVHQPCNPVAAQLEDRRLVLRMLAGGQIRAEQLITHRLPWSRAAEAYQLLEDHRDETLCVLLDWTRDA